MTSVFAYVRDSRAIMIADTLRADIMGLLPPQTVTKIFSWGNCILFGGTGSGPRLARLAAAIISEESSSTLDKAGFLAAFHKHRASHYAEATSGTRLATKVTSLAQGTFLVAVPEMNGVAAHLFTLDSATGTQTDLPANYAAEGTDADRFQAIATEVLSVYQGDQMLPGDIWGSECIRQAITLYPGAVGLPFDVVISKAVGAASFGVQTIRHAQHPTQGDPDFMV